MDRLVLWVLIFIGRLSRECTLRKKETNASRSIAVQNEKFQSFPC